MSGLADPTPDQVALFVECYVRTNDALKAAQQAKLLNPMYAIEPTVARILEREDVQQAVAALKQKTKDKLVDVVVTRESLEAAAQNLHDVAVAGGDNKTALAALRFQAELRKLLGVEMNINVRQVVGEMTDADLMKIVKGRAIEAEFKDVTEPKKGLAIAH